MSTFNMYLYCFLVLGSTCFQLTVDAWSLNNVTDSCYEERGDLYPCSSTILGNLILLVFYGAVLAAAAKCISDGAEMLLDFGLPPSIIGGVVLPILGAVPDAGIIIASGIGKDAQDKLSVGMGTLAGSTVMLLTIAWSASVVVGRCDLNEEGEAVDKTCKGRFSLRKQGVTVLPDIRASIALMLTTSLLYFIVQSADWYWGATLVGHQPTYVKQTALATMVLCIIGFVAYTTYSIFDSKHNERLVRLHKDELMKRRVIHTMLTFMAAPGARQAIKDEEETADGPVVAKKYFKAWHVKTGSKGIKEKLGLLQNEEVEEGGSDVEANEEQPKEQPEEQPKEQPMEQPSDRRKEILKCIGLLVGGVALITLFSDPMCNVLTSLTNKKNKSYIPIPTFYVSFVVTPFCSNASELVSSLIFASKKTKENITMTFSQIFGAATMNNTMCFAIFMALVYFKDLEWIYGAEVLCIVLVQWVVGIISYTKTYKIWMGIPVGITYIVCIFLVWVLEYKAGWH